MSAFTRLQIVTELKREIEMRKKVYPDSIRLGRLTKEESARRIEILQQVIDHYEGQEELKL